ncbi:MAG: hypothetical protein JSV09_11385 [Thermoplasmata archaeon]|nr:MAG: hypothetical protein JSV09_11385 [Thermoplasmata archaeon]
MELLPKFDCGLCGNPVCMALARNILSKVQKPEDCVFLSQDYLRKIKDIIPEKEIERKHPHPNVDKDIIEIHPCTEDGKVTLETQLKSKIPSIDFYSDFFDQIQMCTSLSEVSMFSKINCSPKMGYALVEIGGKRTHIFKTGKIIMRRADNKEDALSTFSKISSVLLPSRICSCGNMLTDCLGGGCGACQENVCSDLFDILEIKDGEKATCITMLDLLKDMDINSHGNLKDNFNVLNDMVNEIREIHNEERMKEEEYRLGKKEKIDEMAFSVQKNCVKTILENGEGIETIIALSQYGLVRNLIRVRDGFLNFDLKGEMKSYEQAAKLFFEAYDAFERKDKDGSQEVGIKYREFIASSNTNPSFAQVAKIATNGFYISRILGIPVPDIIGVKR